MSFPTMTNTWEFSRLGLTNVIPLPEGGGPYTIGMTKASGGYTAQLFWSPNLDASPLDDSWNVLTDLNTTDEVAVAASNKDVRAIMASITVRPTPVLSKGIYTPIAKCEISVVPTNSRGAQNQRRHGSGYGANLIGGAAPVQDEYAALVLADMGVTAGMFFEMQDGILSPLTDTGPDGVTDMVDATGITLVDGPWEGTKAHNGQVTMSYISSTTTQSWGASESDTFECWFKADTLAFNDLDYFMGAEFGGFGSVQIGMSTQSEGNTFMLRGTNASADDIADPGAWLASTAYSIGDRRRAVADNSRVAECEVAGTSAACEPTWPTDGTTVVDGGTLTWRDNGGRNGFHDFVGSSGSGGLETINKIEGTTPCVAGVWFHVVGIRTPTSWELYVNGVKEGEIVLANLPGQFGTPKRMAYTVSYDGSRLRMGNSSGGSEGLVGALAYCAEYRRALTPAEILSHYNKGVELGL